MKRLALLPILLSLLLISGCEDINTSYTETEFVPGEVWVKFSKHVTLEDASDFLNKEEELSAIDLSSLETDLEANWALIRVPEGDEQLWVRQLLHYPFIETARRNTREVSS